MRFGDRCQRRGVANESTSPSNSVQLMFHIPGSPLGEVVEDATDPDYPRCRSLAVTGPPGCGSTSKD
jgi:hypothetical protein